MSKHRFCLNCPKIAMLGVAIALCTAASTVAYAQTFTDQVVQATANIYGAGRSGDAAFPSPGGTTSNAPGPAGGTAATVFDLTAGANRVLTFASVTGSITYDAPDGFPFYGADGGTDSNGGTAASSVESFQGISGITLTDRHGPLVGVFIDGPPAGYADGASGSDAAPLSYDAASIALTQYSPALNQTFFVGDGLTGTGSGTVQDFFVPAGATELVLGFSDAPNYNGLPGSYNDNAGSLTASFSVTGSASAPEPGSIVLLALSGLPAIGLASRRRQPRAAACGRKVA